MWAPPTGVLVTADEIRVRRLFGERRVSRAGVRAFGILPPPPIGGSPVLELYADGAMLLRQPLGASLEPAVRDLLLRVGIPEVPPARPATSGRAVLPAGDGRATPAATATYRAPKRLTMVRLMGPAVLLVIVAVTLVAATPLVGVGLILIWSAVPLALVLRPRWTREVEERLLVKVTPEQIRVRSLGRDLRSSRADVAAFHIDDLPPRLVLHKADGSATAAAGLADRVDRDELRRSLRQGGLTEV
jgi:hypothetical protein